MIYTMLKTTRSNNKPKYLKYREYKNFSLGIFKEDLTENLRSDCNTFVDFDRILTCCQLNKHAMKKNK